MLGAFTETAFTLSIETAWQLLPPSERGWGEAEVTWSVRVSEEVGEAEVTWSVHVREEVGRG